MSILNHQSTVEQYTEVLRELLPPGIAFNREPGSVMTRLLQGLAVEFTRLEDKARELIQESNPATCTNTTIDAHYKEMGLPNNCSQTAASSFAGKQSEIFAQMVSTGGASLAYFKSILDSLIGVDKYTITQYNELYPLTTVGSQIGAQLSGLWDPIVQNYVNPNTNAVDVLTFEIKYLDTNFKQFRAGQGVAGDKLEDFGLTNSGWQCIINTLKPAHLYVIYTPVTSL